MSIMICDKCNAQIDTDFQTLEEHKIDCLGSREISSSKDIIGDAKQWVGELLYENNVHQRETQIYDRAENELEQFILKALADQKKGLEEKHEWAGVSAVKIARGYATIAIFCWCFIHVEF